MAVFLLVAFKANQKGYLHKRQTLMKNIYKSNPLPPGAHRDSSSTPRIAQFFVQLHEHRSTYAVAALKIMGQNQHSELSPPCQVLPSADTLTEPHMSSKCQSRSLVRGYDLGRGMDWVVFGSAGIDIQQDQL